MRRAVYIKSHWSSHSKDPNTNYSLPASHFFFRKRLCSQRTSDQDSCSGVFELSKFALHSNMLLSNCVVRLMTVRHISRVAATLCSISADNRTCTLLSLKLKKLGSSACQSKDI